jgi:hypothetical protein
MVHLYAALAEKNAGSSRNDQGSFGRQKGCECQAWQHDQSDRCRLDRPAGASCGRTRVRGEAYARSRGNPAQGRHNAQSNIDRPRSARHPIATCGRWHVSRWQACWHAANSQHFAESRLFIDGNFPREVNGQTCSGFSWSHRTTPRLMPLSSRPYPKCECVRDGILSNLPPAVRKFRPHPAGGPRMP